MVASRALFSELCAQCPPGLSGLHLGGTLACAVVVVGGGGAQLDHFMLLEAAEERADYKVT